MRKCCYAILGNTFFQEPNFHGVSIKTKKELIKLFKDKGYIWNKYEKLFLNNELERYIQIDKVKYEDF